MNKFIGTVKDNYMFTNRLSNIKVGDILYNYDKKGKRKKGYCFGNCEECVSGKWESNQGGDYDVVGCNRGLLSVPYLDCFDEIYQGTGKINAKYCVVEVWRLSQSGCSDHPDYWVTNKTAVYVGYLRVDDNVIIPDFLVDDTELNLTELEYNNHKYMVQLELIEQVDYELSEFVSYSRLRKQYQYYKHYLSFEIFVRVAIKTPSALHDLEDDCKLKRYNSLMKVIHIGDNNA